MKIQKVQFPLNIGIADELKIHINNIVGVEDSISVFYNLSDTSQLFDIGMDKLIPKILHSGRLKIEGDDYLAYKQDSKYIDNLIINLLGVTVIE